MKSIMLAISLPVLLAFSVDAAAGDEQKGRATFEEHCARCHSFDPGASGFRGPHLAGLFKRRYGSVEGFPYRMVWTAADPVWTRRHLNDYLEIHSVAEVGNRQGLIDFLAEVSGD